MGIDGDGVVHVQAFFGTSDVEDTDFTWKLAFIMHRKPPGSEHLLWGVWDGTRILADTDDKDAVLRMIGALLEKGYFLADTLLPAVIPAAEGGYMSVIPPDTSERVDLDTTARTVLQGQREKLTGERTCPGCGLTKPEGEWAIDIKDLGVRETMFGKGQVNSFGFRCEACGTVWGHEEPRARVTG